MLPETDHSPQRVSSVKRIGSENGSITKMGHFHNGSVPNSDQSPQRGHFHNGSVPQRINHQNGSLPQRIGSLADQSPQRVTPIKDHNSTMDQSPTDQPSTMDQPSTTDQLMLSISSLTKNLSSKRRFFVRLDIDNALCSPR